MTTTTSFGDLNSGLQAGIINGNVTAQFRKLAENSEATELMVLLPQNNRNRHQFMRACGICG